MNANKSRTLSVRLDNDADQKFTKIMNILGTQNQSDAIRHLINLYYSSVDKSMNQSIEMMKSQQTDISEQMLLKRIKSFLLCLNEQLTEDTLRKEYTELCNFLFLK